MLYDVDIEASACVLSSRYAMLCYTCVVTLYTVLLHFTLWGVVGRLGLGSGLGLKPV